MTLLEAVNASLLVHLKRWVDTAAKEVVTFSESEGEVVIIYSHTDPTHELRKHVFRGGIHYMLHLTDLDLTGES